MIIITSQKLKDKFKSRLRSQRRVFSFDDNKILVLPFLEHNDLDNVINNIKFFINENGNYKMFSEIKELEVKGRHVVIVFKNKEKEFLYQQNTNGKFSILEISPEIDLMKQLTIEHAPSIQIVLLSKYLNNRREFDVLSNFSKSIIHALKVDLYPTSIKKKKFKEDVEYHLALQTNKEEIISAYNAVFNEITLEILHADKNNANLSKSSLDYYIKNSHNNKQAQAANVHSC